MGFEVRWPIQMWFLSLLHTPHSQVFAALSHWRRLGARKKKGINVTHGIVNNLQWNNPIKRAQISSAFDKQLKMHFTKLFLHMLSVSYSCTSIYPFYEYILSY